MAWWQGAIALAVLALCLRLIAAAIETLIFGDEE